MSEECFITSEHDKGYIYDTGSDYVVVCELETDEKYSIYVEESLALYFKDECDNGEASYVLFDKEKLVLI